jgi:hypothetical protein
MTRSYKQQATEFLVIGLIRKLLIMGSMLLWRGGRVNRIWKIPILPRDGVVRWRKSGEGVESR